MNTTIEDVYKKFRAGDPISDIELKELMAHNLWHTSKRH